MKIRKRGKKQIVKKEEQLKRVYLHKSSTIVFPVKHLFDITV